LFNESSECLKFNHCLNKYVYNNFPWPENATARQREAIAEKAQAVLDARARFMDSGSARVPRAGFGVAPQPPAHPTLPSGATPDGAAGTVALPAKTATLADLYDPLAMGK
jgi:hypothetical protein